MPVWLDGTGPFDFIVDTGASRSMLASHAQDRLSRHALTQDRLRVEALTGAIDVPTIAVASFRVGDQEFGSRSVGVLPRLALRSADGLLGQDVFENALLEFDFAASRVAVHPHPPAAALARRSPWAVRVPLLRDAAGRACMNVRVEATRGDRRATRVRALIDTGALRSVAWPGFPGLRAATLVGSASATVLEHLSAADGTAFSAQEVDLPALRVGAVRWPAGPGLLAAPAENRAELLLLGLDRLYQLHRLILDYARSTIALLPRR